MSRLVSLVSGTFRNVSLEIDKFESKILAIENDIDELEQKLEQVRGAKELLVGLLKNAGLEAPALVYKSAGNIYETDEIVTDTAPSMNSHSNPNISPSTRSEPMHTHNYAHQEDQEERVYVNNRNGNPQESTDIRVNAEPHHDRILPPNFYAKTISVVNTSDDNRLETIPETDEDKASFERKRRALIRSRISHNPMKDMQEMENKRIEEQHNRNLHNNGRVHEYNSQNTNSEINNTVRKHSPSEISSMVL